MYEPQSLTAWMSLGENQIPSSIDFNTWLKGEELTQRTFEGVIDTDLTLPHIKKYKTRTNRPVSFCTLSSFIL